MLKGAKWNKLFSDDLKLLLKTQHLVSENSRGILLITAMLGGYQNTVFRIIICSKIDQETLWPESVLL